MNLTDLLVPELEALARGTNSVLAALAQEELDARLEVWRAAIEATAPQEDCS